MSEQEIEGVRVFAHLLIQAPAEGEHISRQHVVVGVEGDRAGPIGEKYGLAADAVGAQEVDDAGGGGASEQSSSFTAALPSRDAIVSVRKLRGRGRVSLVQSPDRSNGYTAIVRVEDDKAGDDAYEFELGWY